MNPFPPDDGEPREVPVFDFRELVMLVATAAWAVAIGVAFAQWNDVRGEQQDPFTALVTMAPWVITAMGITSLRRMLD